MSFTPGGYANVKIDTCWRVRKVPMQKVNNVFEAILKYGHDEDFAPFQDDDFSATEAPAGSDAKIAILRTRVEMGQPLWHDNDRCDYSGLTGAIRPRD